MKPERWRQINDLFQSAAERAPEERAAFLEEACHGDQGLRREVESLIACDERSQNFIESPVFETAPELLISDGAGALIGELIGHYLIERLIGVGGMGEVYLARDVQLGRKAALKLLPEHLTADEAQLSRFKTEARSASALNHPNILTVYEIGSDGKRQFIATEFIEGVTLRTWLADGRMNLRAALEIAVQVASALTAAHEAGVVHRDVKPENIMLRPDGYAKVLDFGIAKLTEEGRAREDHELATTSGLQTRPGLVLGTAHYMSPEQARGQKVDARSDIWSLGVVLYEMVAGILPFTGETPSDCIASILTKEPPPLSGVLPDVPPKLEALLQKVLRKDKGKRYQTTRDMLADLRSLKGELELAGPARAGTIVRQIKRHKRGVLLMLAVAILAAGAFAYSFFFVVPPPPPNEKSIAVMPFENLSEEKSNAYFADGVQEEILTRLSKIADLKVISRTSTQQYQSKPRSLREIARQLGVANILEGSVQRVGDQVRVNVQLVSAQSDSHLWADTYDRKLTDILEVESEIAKRIGESLQAKLTGHEEQALAVKTTNNPEAYDAYLRGLAFDGRSTYPFNLLGKAIGFYEQAVQLDPKFAVAWARLSRADALLYFAGDDTTSARRDAAKRALENAQKLQPDSPETLLALGYYQYWVLYDCGAAKATFGQARKMLPGSSEVPRALGYVARREGFWNESIVYFQEALTLDPRNVQLVSDFAETYTILRQFSAALKLEDRALDVMPDDPGVMAEKADIYHAQGKLQEAATCLSAINWQTASAFAFGSKINQLRFERNYAEAIRLLRDRLTQFRYGSKDDKAYDQVTLALMHRLAGDAAAANVTAEQTRDTLEQLHRDQPDNWKSAVILSQAYAAAGQKDSAIETAERAIMLLPRAKDPLKGPTIEENLARIQAMFGENSRAIANLSRLLQTPYVRLFLYSPTPITPALLRLDPLWDPLRADPAFQKLCEEKQP